MSTRRSWAGFSGRQAHPPRRSQAQPPRRLAASAHRDRRSLAPGLRRGLGRAGQTRLRRVSCAARSPGTPNKASPSSASCPTTPRPTTRICGATRAASWTSSRDSPGPTRPAQTAKPKRSSRPCSESGPTATPTPPAHHRTRALAGWIRWYNNHRPHGSLEGKPPISRVSHVRGQYISRRNWAGAYPRPAAKLAVPASATAPRLGVEPR